MNRRTFGKTIVAVFATPLALLGKTKALRRRRCKELQSKSNKITTGEFMADGGKVELPLGFKPDYVRLIGYGKDGREKPEFYEWWPGYTSSVICDNAEGIVIAKDVMAEGYKYSFIALKTG